MLGSSLLNKCFQSGIEAVGTSKSEANICDFNQLQTKCAQILPTHIINCAAYTDVDGAERNPEMAFAVNAEGAGNVAKIASDFGASLVHISTDYVFGGVENIPYTEDSHCSPINTYGKSKWEGEKKIREILPHACIVRTSWIFGPKGKNFISSLLNCFQQRQELQVVSDQCGRPTYCEDLSDAILKVLNLQGIVHFANEGPSSRYQIALDLLTCVNKLLIPIKCKNIIPVSSSGFPTPALRPSYSVLDTNKYTQLTSLKPRPWIQAAEEFLKNA